MNAGGSGAGAASAVVIINPVSGPPRRGTAQERVAVATRALEKAGINYRIRLTERPNHAYDMAGAAVEAGATLVIAWGGDGTINEVGQAVAFTKASLGLVPGGSGNGLARELSIPFDPRRAIERALTAPDRRIDVGEISGRMFFNVAGIGLDARVAAEVAATTNRRGLFPYLAASTRALLSHFPVEYTIETETGTVKAPALLVALANSPQYGYGTRLAPLAVMDDGLLDLVVVESRSFAGNLLRLPSLFLRRFHRQPGVHSSRVREVRIRASSRMLFHVDGEVVEGERELIARVHAGALRVRA